MSLQDEFDMGRIPLKPLAYSKKELAQKSEFLIDYAGDEPTYHMYIVDPADETKIIDITAALVKEGFGKSIAVHIDGMEEPMNLHDLLNFIYKRFTYADNINGYVPSRDREKAKSGTIVLLRDIDGEYYLPVTSADAIIDTNGLTVQERLDSISRLGFSNDYISVETDDQNVFEITYPFNNYSTGGNYFELRVGTVFVDKSRYQVIDNFDEEGNAYGATITFFNDRFEAGRRIDILYIYNSNTVATAGYFAITGGQIANFTIPTTKLEKVSDNFNNPDATSIPTSKALYDAYNILADMAMGSQSRYFYLLDEDTSSQSKIRVNLFQYSVELDNRFIIANIYISNPKNTSIELSIVHGKTSEKTKKINITIPEGMAQGRLLKIMANSDTCKVLTMNAPRLRSTRFIYTCTDQETEISFSGLSYDSDGTIKVYRNGVKLFKDLDYMINMSAETITLFVRTEEGERIVFENEYIEY